MNGQNNTYTHKKMIKIGGNIRLMLQDQSNLSKSIHPDSLQKRQITLECLMFPGGITNQSIRSNSPKFRVSLEKASNQRKSICDK